jgi:hypothetical protein
MTTYTDIPAFVFNATVTNTTDDGYLSVASDPNTIADHVGRPPGLPGRDA